MVIGLYKKGIALGIVMLFIGSFVPNISGDIAKSNMMSSSNTDWWPMFHHDLHHSGYSTSDAPDTNNILWSYPTEIVIFESSPTVFNNKIYIGSYDCKIYCLDADNGDFIWSYSTGDIILSSPAVAGGKVYIGSCDHKVYCLDAVNGDFIWSYTTGNPVDSSPAVCNGRVYIGSIDGKVYCLDAATGDFIWSCTTGGRITSSPAVCDGKVYVGSSNWAFYCLNASDGRCIWAYPTGGWVVSSPAVVNGKVYVGSGYPTPKFYCLNATNGNFIWSYIPNGYIQSSPAVFDNKVYFGSYDHKIYCLNADTGAWIWDYTTGDIVKFSPAIADGKVYIGSLDDKVYCLNAKNGSKIWSYTCGGSSPTVADGKVFVAANMSLYCFEDLNSNQWPVADFIWAPLNPCSNDEITFNASASYDLDGTIDLYEWDWDNDGIYDESHTSPIVIHTWSEEGCYSVTLRVTDNKITTDTKTKTVNVDNEPPLVSIQRPDNGNLYFRNRMIFPIFLTTVIIGDIVVEVYATDEITGVSRVEFYLDDNFQFSVSSEPYFWAWNDDIFGKITIKVTAYDKAGNSASDEITVWKFF